MPPSDLIRTGIDGLDGIFLGGIIKGNVILVEGAAGTGKTLLGTEFIYRGVTEFDEPGIIVMFETAPQKLIRDAASFGWDLDALQRQDRLKLIFTSPQILHQELRSPDSILLETAARIGAHRIFIDGISLLHSVANSGNSDASYREMLQQLIEGLHRENLTALLTHEIISQEAQAQTLEVAEFLADTVILLRQEDREGDQVKRTLQIKTTRGQDFEAGKHTLRISSGRGLQVFRRVQARPRGDAAQPTSTTKRSAIGVAALDSYRAQLAGKSNGR